MVIPKQEIAFGRRAEIFDTTIGWRFVNPLLKKQYGIDSMPETGENVAEQFGISREDQDAFALASQQKAAAAQDRGFFSNEIIPVTIPQRRGDPIVVDTDEHPRADTTLEKLARLNTPFRDNGTVTAGNASGVNDGACALLLASEEAASANGLQAIARVLATATAGVEPRIMGIGPVSATRKVLALCGLTLEQMDVVELNEAFAAQGLAVLRELGLADDAAQVNPNGGAIALGHPLGMSGARLITTAAYQLRETGGRYALCTMCIGVGQGIATIIERV
jgi:acetyl-CoA acetyltransferase family protein